MAEDQNNPKPTPRMSKGSVPTTEPKIKALGYTYNEASDDVTPDPVKPKGKGIGWQVSAPQPKPSLSVGRTTEAFKKETQEGVENLTPKQKQELKIVTDRAIEQANQLVEFKEGQLNQRQTELDEITGKRVDANNLFVAVKDENGKVLVGKNVVNTPDDLEALLQDPYERSVFYNEQRAKLAQYFYIRDAKDFDNVLAGGLSEYEKYQYSKDGKPTIYSKVFNRQSVPANQPGYRTQFDQFAPDPIANAYDIPQLRYQANQTYTKLENSKLNVDAYGQPFKSQEDFYDYLIDPVNRDAYSRKYSKALKEIGVTSVNDILNPVVLKETSFAAEMARMKEFRTMRVAKGQDLVENGVIGKSGTIYDENENSSAISNISDIDLGRVLYEYDLGNNIGIDIPNAKEKTFNDLNRDGLVEMLSNEGLSDDEIDEVLITYKAAYERSLGEKDYADQRKKLGYTTDPFGNKLSRFDLNLEARAKGELSAEEQKIAKLYDQIDAIYAKAEKPKTAAEKQYYGKYKLSADQTKQITDLRGQIEEMKRQAGFFGLNNLPTQEFFDSDGNRLEGEDKEKAQTVFSNTLSSEKKTDKAILKEKRNVLYVQLDGLEKKLKDFKLGRTSKNVVLPAGYDPEDLDARYNAARDKEMPYLAKVGSMITSFGGGGDIVFTDQMKANFIYERNLKDKIIEKKAQIKAANQIIYTNVDLTTVDGKGVGSNFVNKFTKDVTELFTGGTYLTPAEEVIAASDFLQQSGQYVNPEVINSIETIYEDKALSEGLLNSMGVMLQMGLMQKSMTGGMTKLFTGQTAVTTRAYMANRYGRTGIVAYNMIEKAATTYGRQALLFESVGLDGSMGAAEELGNQLYDKVTGVFKLGRFVPANIIGKLMTILGRTVSGAAGSLTEESFANVWDEFRKNGFDIREAVENAYGKTEDERLLNFRMTANSCIIFSAGNISNLNILFKTRQAYSDYLQNTYGNDVSEFDSEILTILDSTIKNTRGAKGDTPDEPQVATASATAADNSINKSNSAVEEQMVMSTGPVESDQNISTNSFTTSGVGTEGVQVEKRTGNMGEEFYVGSENGVVDNKVVYRYNAETGQLEAQGLTSTTDEFVPLNDKTRQFVDEQSKKYGIVSKEKVENIAIKNLDSRRASQEKIENGEDNKDDTVLYQSKNKTTKRKEKRMSQTEASARARYQSGFNEDAQQRVGLFTGIASEVNSEDDAVKELVSEMGKNFGVKMKINLISYFKDGAAVITDLARKKFAHVSDYMAPLFKDFDNQFFDTQTDDQTGQTTRQRKQDTNVDKVREAVSRNTLFEQVFGKMVAEGKMTKEDAIDNFIINLLQNSNGKIKEIFGNDRTGIESFQKLRKDFNNFVAVKYTGANTFSGTNAFVRNTPMSKTTSKNRAADLKKQAAEVAQLNEKRRKTANVLSNTQKQGSFIEDNQVDAAMFLDGDLNAEDFLQNIGVETKANETQDQVQDKAKKQAEKLIDYAKYTEGKRLVAENDATREKYRKELNKKFKEDWGLKASFKTRFRFKKMREQRAASAEAALRIFENKATRMGITLQEFMDTRIGMLKRTEQQFQDWLKMSPNLVPLFQNVSNLSTQDIYPNTTKALDLKEKNYPNDKILFMTGVALDEDGQPIGFDPLFKISAQETKKGLISGGYGFTERINLYTELLNSLRYAAGASFDIDKPSKYDAAKRFFGRRQRFQDVSKYLTAAQVINTKDNEELYTQYPDFGLIGVRIVDDANYPAVSFKPNHFYEGNGKSKTKPGEIIINVQKLLNVTQGDMENIYPKFFEKSMVPKLQQSFRQAVQFMEGELPNLESVDFVTPTTVRSKVLELKAKKLIDENTEGLINDILNFYIDKNAFQFGSYTTLFGDISRVLFLGGNEKVTSEILDSFANKYDLSSSDVQTLGSIYNNYFKSYGQTDLARIKNVHNAFLVLNKLANLNNSELVAVEITNDLLSRNLKTQTAEGVSVDMNFEQTALGEFVEFAYFHMLDVVDVFDGNEQMQYAIEPYYQSLEAMQTFAGFLQGIKNEKRPLTKSEIERVKTVINSEDFKKFTEFFTKVINQDEFVLKDGSTGVLFDINDLMQLEMEDGILIPMPFYVATEFSDIINDYENKILVEPTISTDLKLADDIEAREVFYEMYPGIDKFSNGIYDPYKDISEFSEQELRESLVDSGLVSEKQFSDTYAGYQKNPNLFTGSAASIFLEPISDLSIDDKKSLQQILARAKSMQMNMGTAFYSNVEQAAAQIISETGKSGRIQLEGLKTRMSKIAKPSELEWLNIDDFIASFGDSKTINAETLMAWASSAPNFISFNADSLQQETSIDEVVYLGTSAEQTARTEAAFEEKPFQQSGRQTDDPVFVVKRNNGTVRFFNLSTILDESLDLYENYIGKPEYAKFKKSFDDLKKTAYDFNESPEFINQLSELIKIFYQSTDELVRGTTLDMYTAFNATLEGAIENSYNEHLIGIPLSQNQLFKNYSGAILDILSEMKSLEKEFISKNPSREKIKRFNTLENELNSLVKERDALAKDYYNDRHFKNIQNEVLMHVRTQVVIGPNGERMLHLIEIQSDKTQDFRTMVLNPIKEKYPATTQLLVAAGQLKNKNKNITDAELKTELLKRGYDFATGNQKAGFSSDDIDVYLKREEELSKARETFKKTTFITESEQFVDLGIKHALKIASDLGIKKIVLSNGHTVAPAVGVSDDTEKIQGINTLYNKTIPSKASKLASKYGFKMGTVTLKVKDYGQAGDPDSPEPVDTSFTKKVNLKNQGFPILEQLGQDVLPVNEKTQPFIDEVGLTFTGSTIMPGNKFYTLELTDKTFQEVAAGMALFQQDMHGAHGATVKTDQGKFIIFALTNPNITTAMHELAHVWEDSLTATEKKAFLKEVGHDKWTRATSEAFARGFEKYLADGKAPTSSLANLFANFKKWFLQVYGGIIGTPIEMKVSEPMRKLYDSMLGETQVKGVQMKKTPNVIEDIGNFIKDIKANPQFEEITDDELYTSLIRSGFEPQDVQDYFSLKQRANIEKQQQRDGMFKEEADAMENEAEAMRVVRDKKELMDAIDNIDPNDYVPMIEALYTTVENGDVPLAKSIMDLIAAKQNGGDSKMIHEQYSKILKAGTGIGRMLQLFKQLSKETYMSGAEAMFKRNEKQGLYIPEGAKNKIRDLANELDKLKDLYKESRDLAETDPYGESKIDPSKTNLQYHLGLYDQLQGAQKRYVDARAPFEGDNSLTDMYRSFIKGGLMTPGSMSVNALSNITKYFTDLFVSPIRSGISLLSSKLGITNEQYTKTGWSDWVAGNKYGFKSGIKKAAKILKDGTVTQAYQTPEGYVQGYSFYKSLQKFIGLKIDQYRVKAGDLDMTNEELAEKHGFALTDKGDISSKQQAIALLQGTFGLVPDVVFRVMGATDAVFRDFAYYSSVSEQFKFTSEHDKYKKAISAAKTKEEKSRLEKEYNAVRKAYIIVNSDYQNTAAQEEAMRYVYNNDNGLSSVISKVQSAITRDVDDAYSIPAKITRVIGTSIIPFTRIPVNYAVELLEFFIPEYALTKIGIEGGIKAVRRSSKLAKGTMTVKEAAAQRRSEGRDADRILARALIGTGIQFLALQAVKFGCVSGAPDDETDDEKKSKAFSYTLERPYSINLTLLKDRMKTLLDSDYVSKRPNDLWDKENDLIISYKSMGLFGAALYFQFKENKLALNTKSRFINRGAFEQAANDFSLSLFGNTKSAGKYIIDQTFVRGLMSVAQAVASEDEGRLPTFLSDIVGTMATGLVPNSLSWIDKWRRNYVIDYDFREAPPVKMFGIKVEDPHINLFLMRLGTKLAERWPWKSIPGAYVDLPFVEIDLTQAPVKVDNFGKDVMITPDGSSSLGKFMYNTFDVFQISRIIAGYQIPDWEALVMIACKKGGVWEALPSAPPRQIETPFGAYKYAPDEYNNLLRYNAMLRRRLVQEFFIETGDYKTFIDPKSEMNFDPTTNKPITGQKNPNVLLGYEKLGEQLSKMYNVADRITKITNYTFIDQERKKLLDEDEVKYFDLLATETLSPMGQYQKEVYGNQENGGENLVKTEKGNEPLFNINYKLIEDPKRFKNYAKGAMKLMLQYQSDPKTAILTAKNQTAAEAMRQYQGDTMSNGLVLEDEQPEKKPEKKPMVKAIEKQTEQAKPSSQQVVLSNGLILE